MGNSNQKQNEAADQVVYTCPECGCQMVLEEGGLLVCPECGISMGMDQFEA